MLRFLKPEKAIPGLLRRLKEDSEIMHYYNFMIYFATGSMIGSVMGFRKALRQFPYWKSSNDKRWDQSVKYDVASKMFNGAFAGGVVGLLCLSNFYIPHIMLPISSCIAGYHGLKRYAQHRYENYVVA